MQDDDHLMMAYRQGDVQAYETLIHRYRRPVFAFLRRMLKDDALAEEVLMETFFNLHRSAAQYEPRGQFKTFLYRIAYRLGLNAVRDHQRWRGHEALNEGLPTPEAASWHTQAPEPDDLLLQRQSIQLLQRALDKLPSVQRTVFLLYYKEELDTQAIAEVVDIPVGSVRAYLCMARKTLRGLLEREGL